MPRTVEVTVPPQQREALLDDIKKLEGLLGLRVQQGVSLQPPGDVIQLQVTTDALHELMRLLDHRGLGRDEGLAVTTSVPTGIISEPHSESISTDDSEAIWEEMELTIAKESNMTANGLLLMAFSGMVAAFGIATDTLHLVIGAMIIAPGFEPISRFSLGIISRSRIWQRGLIHTLQGYGTLAASALLSSFALLALDYSLLGSGSAYLPPGVLVDYWTSFSAPSIIVSAAGSLAGGILIASNRSVLTAGVMITLALVPALVIAPMALVASAWSVMGLALLRWLLEVCLVAGGALIVFGWKQQRQQRKSHAK